MPTITTTKNWETDTTPKGLNQIHQNHINIAIYQRDITSFIDEVNNLLEQGIQLKASGNIDTILNEIVKTINPDTHKGINQDIKSLLHLFKEVTGADNFRLMIATVNTNMCRKFHTDINNLRMLCTYSGPGTLWLTEDNINRKALDTRQSEVSIAIRENDIQQVQAGDVAILKGALYPNTKSAVVHRSPTIEETGERRLLLRIDTNDTQNLWS